MASSMRGRPSRLHRLDRELLRRAKRIARRRGKSRALVAVGRSILTIGRHLLNQPDTHFHDLGPDYYDTMSSRNRRVRLHMRELQELGFRVPLEPAA